MTSSGGDAPPPLTANGGEFLLSLLQKPQSHHPPQQSPLRPRVAPMTVPQPQAQSLAIDPAVQAVGPTLPFSPSWSPNGRDLPSSWPHNISPPFDPNLIGFRQNPWFSPGNQIVFNQEALVDDLRRIGLSRIDNNNNHVIPNLTQLKHREQKLVFGSFPSDIQTLSKPDGVPQNSNLKFSNQQSNWRLNSNPNSSPYFFQRRNSDERGKQQQHDGNCRSTPSAETPRPPPGFSGKPRRGGGGSRDFGKNARHVEHSVNKLKAELGHLSYENETRLRGQLDHPVPPAGSNPQSVSVTEIEGPLLELHMDGGANGFSRRDKPRREDGGEVDEIEEKFVEPLLVEDESDDKNDKKRHHREKEYRKDNRGQSLLSQRERMLKRRTDCRSDILRLNSPLRAIYESLIPPVEEKAKQKQLLALLEKLVCKEWPEARLYLYGSCENSFGVSKSDIDICLAFNEDIHDKSEILLKLADILQSDNLQNVQALTRARVPIVKLMDPVTGISCDICINNVLAVVNTRLLRDYAKIDVRLRQLAFIVKHWAKSRGVNATYQGTLSSYAYVLMCIHFLQQRRPAILPCLQGMETTFSVTVDDVECAYFDKVENLCNFGSSNQETIAQLVWAFFNYWAYIHDYANSVISVRTGSLISKGEKDWTRRIGNDRHLICIEDPFVVSHDLGRVVDKFSIKVLREEFERAADVMQYDPNPWIALFEPYVPG
ncbi:UTP:RNA uridylyltransferase 1 [Gossypium arboreum]|uniref:UTP:RNA uridylyltransferase 1 n=1 Tax=Gossypium arboreum TaxID=29729 RepID=A0ABR0MYS4_GOSAR|nr:UTP:RNA uridylyltransferase 1 [Gossypium arboreum]KAK5783444.1 hypothetical protein PVK06_037952 [Gossypium arboreum]